MTQQFEAWMPKPVIDASARISDAREAGLGKAKMSSEKFVRPFYGVRSLTEAKNARERASQYLSKLSREQAFGGITAMRLWGLPVPGIWSLAEPVWIAVPSDAYSPRSKGVKGMRLTYRRRVVVRMGNTPLLAPVQAILSAAGDLSDEDLVVALDALLTRSTLYPDPCNTLPTLSSDAIEQEIDSWGCTSASNRLRAALGRARSGVDSPMESRLRCALIDAGLPEPELQHPLTIDGRERRLDVAYPHFRVGGEYEGDHHRTDAEQWHSDIARERSLRIAGWNIIRVTARDLRPEHRLSLTNTFARALYDAGWQRS